MIELKIGDRVFIKHGYQHDHCGKSGVIKDITERKPWNIEVLLTKGGIVYFDNHELELDKPSIVKEIIKDL